VPIKRLGLAVTLLLVLCASIVSIVFAQPANDPSSVVAAFEAARNRGDIDAALAYFTDDATITQRTSVFTGKDDIRRFLQSASARGRTVQVTNRRGSGGQVTWLERPPQGQNLNPFEVSVQAVVQDGKIKSLVYNAAIATARSDTGADGRGELPALLGLGAVLLVLSGVVLVASTNIGRPGMSQSRLRGRLLHDLRGWRAERGLSS
jgi:hypothetical protein